MVAGRYVRSTQKSCRREELKPTEVLMTEHRAIERMLAILEAAARRLERGEPVRADLFREAVDFVRNFADRCHHGKEEENLFPRLEERGVPRQGGPLGVMLAEHDQGRAYVGAIADAIGAYDGGDRSAARTIASNALGYVGLLRQHIMKEDNVLFPMADRVLSTGDQQELTQKFQQVETEVMGPGVHERYHQLLDDLERELGLG
jgi:hemerythrin-like domain-containing protein